MAIDLVRQLDKGRVDIHLRVKAVFAQTRDQALAGEGVQLGQALLETLFKCKDVTQVVALQVLEAIELGRRRVGQPLRQVFFCLGGFSYQVEMGAGLNQRIADRRAQLLMQLDCQQLTAELGVVGFVGYTVAALQQYVTLEQPFERQQHRVAFNGFVTHGQGLGGDLLAHGLTLLPLDIAP